MLVTPSVACSVAMRPLVAGSVAGKGRAVFAAEPIAAGELIGIWGGIIISVRQALTLPDAEMSQCIQIARDFALWTGPHLQTEPDWINHSCDPNAGIRGQISVVAMRDIQEGEEICFDYAMCSTCTMDAFTCACGSPRCRGEVRPDDWRLPDLRRRYRGYFSSFIAELIAIEDDAGAHIWVAVPA
jgi:SET domain-containing protein